MDTTYIIIALISYLLGSAPFALWLVKLVFKKDLREGGSKNTGSLNTFRIVSKEKGTLMGIVFFLLAFIFDAGKAVLAVAIAMRIAPENLVLATTIATFFAVLGHNHSIFLKLKGGRGAASLMGVMLYLDWRVFFGWLLIVLFFMFIFEIITGGRASIKSMKHAISEQIIGRLCGEIFAVLWIYFFSPALFYPVALSTILVIIAHKDRISGQLKEMRDKTYFK